MKDRANREVSTLWLYVLLAGILMAGCDQQATQWHEPARDTETRCWPTDLTNVDIARDAAETYYYWGRLCEIAGDRQIVAVKPIVGEKGKDQFRAQAAENRRIAAELRYLDIGVGVDPKAVTVMQGIVDFLELQAALIDWQISDLVQVGIIIKQGIDPSATPEQDRANEVEARAVSVRTLVVSTQAELQNSYRIKFGTLQFLGEGSTPPESTSNGPELPDNVVRGGEGNLLPAPGYSWLTQVAGDLRVRWNPGQAHPQYPNVVASDEENVWAPAAGYRWASDDETDFSVISELE